MKKLIICLMLLLLNSCSDRNPTGPNWEEIEGEQNKQNNYAYHISGTEHEYRPHISGGK